MAEKIVSPGVFTKENDLSFVQAGVGAIGAAVIGPTVKGPALIPTKVWSYSEYQAQFGDSFKSGSDYYQYLTSHAAKDYLKHGGPLTVTRILPGVYGNAEAFAHLNAVAGEGTASTANIVLTAADVVDDGTSYLYYTSSTGANYTFNFVDIPLPVPNAGASGVWYVESGSAGLGATMTNFATIFSTAGTGDTCISSSTAATLTFTGVSGVLNTGLNLDVNGVSGGIPGTGAEAYTSSFAANHAGIPQSGSSNASFLPAFKIKTVSDGLLMNSKPAGTGSNNLLTYNNVISGTKDNLRWEVNTINENKGTFTLLVRRGNDTDKRKVVLETWNNLSLDPQTSNYVGKVIGTSFDTYIVELSGTDFIQAEGTYPRKSDYIYIDEASIIPTVDYLDDNGALTDATATGLLPMVSEGTFDGGSDGDIQHPQKFYGEIDGDNNQGIDCNAGSTGLIAYSKAISLLSNQDEYDINLIFAPGINYGDHAGIVTKLITMCEERGDCMTIVDPVPFGSNIKTATAVAGNFDSSYAAMYWPWVQIADNTTGKYVWVPQSTVMPGIYAFNDKVSAEWFAPAGLNRGGQETVIQAERKLTHANRDDMYEGNLNPVATFPGEGVVVWGQKTLQKKSSALDRVNVRRLLINLKKFIASTSKYLVFENNTDTTRNRFLAQVNPYMESVQQRQGLYAFKVVMDESNNTPDIIDRNIMKGDIFIQPAKAAEFIVIDFNIMPTGATFND